MLLPPPGLFSITKVWPSFSVSHWAMMRASTSVVPPGGYGTIHLTGFVGYSAAAVVAAIARSAAASRRTYRMGFRSPRVVFGIRAETLEDNRPHVHRPDPDLRR